MKQIIYKVDFSYFDDDNIIRREKEKEITAESITGAAIYLKQKYNVIRIRSIREKEETQESILNAYPYLPHPVPPAARKFKEFIF